MLLLYSTYRLGRQTFPADVRNPDLQQSEVCAEVDPVTKLSDSK